MVDGPVKVFVGCAANHEDAESQAVLEYTLRKHSSMDVEITFMKQSRDKDSPFYVGEGSGWATKRWATPFSGFRWAVPFLCGYKGRAIYTDSDVIFMADVAELWQQEFRPGKVVMAKGGGASWRYCVSLWDCRAAKKVLPPIKQIMTDPHSHKKLCSLFARDKAIVQKFDGNWNCLDGENYKSLENDDIKAIHYTSMPHQPHHGYAAERLAAKGIPHWFEGSIKQHWRADLQALFDDLLIEAKENGFPVSKYETDEIFGPYNKASTAQMKGGIPQWGNA